MKRTRALISEIMSKIKAKNTRPEVELQRTLRRSGHKFSTHSPKLPGKPDLVFWDKRVVVFVDGDFWHGKQWKLRGLKSLKAQFTNSHNSSYWLQKIKKNMKRDAAIRRTLRRQGWSVLRIWESTWERAPEQCIAKIQRKLSETT